MQLNSHNFMFWGEVKNLCFGVEISSELTPEQFRNEISISVQCFSRKQYCTQSENKRHTCNYVCGSGNSPVIYTCRHTICQEICCHFGFVPSVSNFTSIVIIIRAEAGSFCIKCTKKAAKLQNISHDISDTRMYLMEALIYCKINTYSDDPALAK